MVFVGRNWAALIVPSFFLFLPDHGFGEGSQSESPVVREVNFAQPLRVRILLEERESSRPLVIRGSHLRINEEFVQGSELVCRHQSEWVCEITAHSGKTKIKKRRFHGKLTVKSDDDFLRVGKAFYRDTLALLPRKNKMKIINELDMESYLVGIVNSEVTSKYPREALKAQVVAARSYALACVRERSRIDRAYDLDSTEIDQVYKGAQVEDPMSHFVVHETRGEVLLRSDRVVKAYYHASSGGALEMPSAVWGSRRGEDEVYSRRDPAAEWDQNYRWKVSFGPWVGLKIPGLGLLRGMEILEQSASERVKRVILLGESGTKILRGSEMRKLFGSRWIKSTLFQVKQNGAKWTLEGRGFGHGVGMSQRGAKKLAEQGWTYEKILTAYYPGAQLGRLPAD